MLKISVFERNIALIRWGGVYSPIRFNETWWLFFRASGFHVDTHPLGVALHHCDLIDFSNKLVLASHVGLAIVVADPGGDPKRIACIRWALVFHVVLASNAAVTQLDEVLKGQPKLLRMKGCNGLHPLQIDRVVGVLEFIKVFRLYSQFADELG